MGQSCELATRSDSYLRPQLVVLLKMRKSRSRIAKSEFQGGTLIEISGIIDETLNAAEFAVGGPAVVFDLNSVEQVTSYGVLEWSRALSQVSAAYYCFINVPPTMVVQFNMVTAFGQRGDLVSLQLPYVCPEDFESATPVVDLRRDFEGLVKEEFPVVTCGRCHGEMEFDDFAPLYLAHVARTLKPAPPPGAQQLIDGPRLKLSSQPLSVRKDIQATVTALRITGSITNKRALRRLAEGLSGDVVLDLKAVDSIDGDGTVALSNFMDACQAQVYVGNIPFHLLAQVEAAIEGRTVKIISVACPAACSQCSWRGHLLLDDATKAGQSGLRCPDCRVDIDDQFTLQRIGRIHGLHAVSGSLRGVLDETEKSAAASSLLSGKYELLHPLGGGGMGEVVLARQLGAGGFQKMVVIKRINSRRSGDKDMERLFLQEARVTALLAHPNIVQIFDIDQDNGQYFIAMEYVDGMDLGVALQVSFTNDLQVSLPVVCDVMISVCAALDATHNYRTEDGTPAPIHHRDVSPDNIMISTAGIVKLTDFGVAKLSHTLPEKTSFKGKLGYAAPERLGEQGPGDARSDLYSVGIVLFELATLRRRKNCITPRMADYRSDLPEALQQIFDRATQVDPNHRFQSAGEFAAELRALRTELDPKGTETIANWIQRVLLVQKPASKLNGNTEATILCKSEKEA